MKIHEPRPTQGQHGHRFPTQSQTDREGGEDPVSGEALGLSKLVIDVSVEVLHAPHSAFFQKHVLWTLLLHELQQQQSLEVTLRIDLSMDALS